MGLMWEGGDKPRTPQFGFYCWNLERSQAWRGRGDPAAEPQGNFSALFSKSDAFCETSSQKRLAWQGQPGGGFFLGGRHPGIGDSAASVAKCPGRRDSGDVLWLCPSNLQANRMLKSRGASRLCRAPPRVPLVTCGGFSGGSCFLPHPRPPVPCSSSRW